MIIEEIEDWIYDLENSVTNADNVLELASLYIVKDNLLKSIKTKNNTVTAEAQDILPAYISYCSKRKQQQMNELPEDACLIELGRLCAEIQELIIAIYAGTCLGKERRIIFNMIENLYNKYKK